MIKSCFYLALIICFSLNKLAAQNSNLVIDAVANSQFIVFVNEVQQNFIPGARVVLTNLPESVYKVKLIDPKTNEILTEEVIKMPPSSDLIYTLRQDIDGVYELDFTSSKTTTTYNFLKIDDENCYTESSKILIHGPYAPLPDTRNFIVSWGSEKVKTVQRQIEYPIEVEVMLYVCETSYLNTVCPTSVNLEVYNDIYSALAKNDDELEKLNITKKIIINQQRNNSCFTAKQVKQLLQLFATDKSKLVIADLAKGYLSDPANKMLLKEAFDNPDLFIANN